MCLHADAKSAIAQKSVKHKPKVVDQTAYELVDGLFDASLINSKAIDIAPNDQGAVPGQHEWGPSAVKKSPDRFGIKKFAEPASLDRFESPPSSADAAFSSA
jgi:hypothetical protein